MTSTPTASTAFGRQRARTAAWTTSAIHWLLLAALVAAILSPALVLDQPSQLYLLKIALAATLTLFPAWIYLLFIGSKGERLYDEYVINLHRLHIDQPANLPAPPQHTTYYQSWKAAHRAQIESASIGTRDNLYRAKFEAVYGPESVSTRALVDPDARRTVRHRTQTFTPILLTTFLLGVGWTLVVRPDGLHDVHLIDALSRLPQLPVEPLRFGFLGAYWFIVQDLVRRYYRDDLTTDAYISAVTRVVVVSLLVTTMGLIPLGTPAQQQVLAFLVGIFPQVGMEVIKAGAQAVLARLVPPLKPEHPLSALQGLTIWDQARLLEEGIEDLENLATANLVDVLLSLRVPVARLVDWIDQSILLIHLSTRANQGPRDRLQQVGIRTATDLEAAWAEATDDGREMLSETIFEEHGCVLRGQALLTAVGREASIAHVRAFRARTWLADT